MGSEGKASTAQSCLKIKIHRMGTSLAVQWLRLHTANAGSTGSSGQGTKFPHAAGPKFKLKKKCIEHIWKTDSRDWQMMAQGPKFGPPPVFIKQDLREHGHLYWYILSMTIFKGQQQS